VNQLQITDDEIYSFERYAFRRFYGRPIAVWRMLKRVTSWHHIRDLFVAANILLLGKHKKKGGYNWDGWRGLNEEDFLDITLGPDQFPQRLTFQLRQGVMA